MNILGFLVGCFLSSSVQILSLLMIVNVAALFIDTSMDKKSAAGVLLGKSICACLCIASH